MRSSLVAVMLLACGVIAEAQQATKIPLIGVLYGGSASAISARIEAFRQRLREPGYVEGKNIIIEYRRAEAKLDRLPTLAAELVRLKAAIIVSVGAPSTHAAKEATSTIPIVMAQDADPVADGFVASLARPGGNITGLATLAQELSGKRLELLKEIVPKLTHVAVVGTSSAPGNAQTIKDLELAGAAFKVKLQYHDILETKDIETAFRAATKEHAEAVIVLQSSVLNARRTQIVELALKGRLPAIYYAAEWVQDGGLVSYGVNYADLYGRATTYVDKILKGAKPADLPVEQPIKFDFIINLKTANQIGLTIPQWTLMKADRVSK